MDQYHLSESIDYANNMLNSTHHLMNQQHQQQLQHQNNQTQYTQLHASNAHRNMNNASVMNNQQQQVQMLNGQKQSNGTSHNGQVNNLNGNHNGNNHNGSNHNGHNSLNGNANHNSNHVNGTQNGNNIGPNTAVVHPTNLHHANAHLNQQLMQLGNAASSPPQHQTPNIQHAQMPHDHLHSLDNSPQLTNLSNNNANNQQQETKYTPPQNLKRKLDEYLEPQMNNDMCNEDGQPMKKIAQANGKKTKGRVKIKMEFIDNKLRRYTTFSKRKTGIMKKAYELSTLTGTQVMLLVASETGHVYTFATKKLQPMITSEAGKALIQTCLNSPDAPNNVLDQRMSATGFEETDLSYSIHDDSSEKDEDSSSSENYMQNDELAFGKFEDVVGNSLKYHVEKEEKLFANLETNRIQQQFGDVASTSTGRQRKPKKLAKEHLNLQLDNALQATKKGRSHCGNSSQINCGDSPQSSCSSTSNSPTGSPTANLFSSCSSLGNLASSVNSCSSLNSTNRNRNTNTNSDHLNSLTNNASQSINPITLIHAALDNYNKNSTASSLPALNLISSPVMNKQFNFKNNKPQQSAQQQTAQLSSHLNNTGNLIFYPSANTPTTLMYQPSQGVVCASNQSSSNVFNDSLILNQSSAANNFDNAQFANQQQQQQQQQAQQQQTSSTSNFRVSSNSQQFSNERKNIKRLKLKRN